MQIKVKCLTFKNKACLNLPICTSLYSKWLVMGGDIKIKSRIAGFRLQLGLDFIILLSPSV